jgi:hypothetical protein
MKFKKKQEVKMRAKNNQTSQDSQCFFAQEENVTTTKVTT